MVSPAKSSSSGKRDAATQENIERAKEYIIKAIYSKNNDVITKIITGGFPVDEPLVDHSKQSMLMFCCKLKDTESHVDTLKVILASNPKINLQDSNGRTALHFACRAGRHDLIKELVKVKGIDVNRRTCGGETPLMSAAQSGNIFTVGECLNNNFNPFLENSLRMTARDYAQYFPKVYGHSLVSVFDTAIEQWKTQIPEAQLKRMITNPNKYFDSYCPANKDNLQ